jgi:MFS family permease
MPQLNAQVWLLVFGRLLSQTGSGFTAFYAPIFFVNQVGLSATQVGFGLGSAAISGVLGRVLGGSFSDSQFWGRKRTLLLSAIVSAISSFVLAASQDFPTFIIGNLLMGLGIGLYWPAAEAMLADLTTPEQRNEAFALSRLSDSLGLGLGVILGGLLIETTGAYRSLFIIDGISFLGLFGMVAGLIQETHRRKPAHAVLSGWRQALSDRRLLVYVLVNVLFTTYLWQVSSTLPLYFTNFVAKDSSERFSPTTISALFTWHLALSVLFQLPAARLLNRFSRVQALRLSAVLWAIGFLCVWKTAMVETGYLAWAALALAILALATVTYFPAASAIVVDLAPESLRGVYLAVNSQCWAIGQLIGPPLGGWALDQSAAIAHTFWLGLAASVVGTIVILHQLQQLLARGRSHE